MWPCTEEVSNLFLYLNHPVKNVLSGTFMVLRRVDWSHIWFHHVPIPHIYPISEPAWLHCQGYPRPHSVITLDLHGISLPTALRPSLDPEELAGFHTPARAILKTSVLHGVQCVPDKRGHEGGSGLPPQHNPEKAHGHLSVQLSARNSEGAISYSCYGSSCQDHYWII